MNTCSWSNGREGIVTLEKQTPKNHWILSITQWKILQCYFFIPKFIHQALKFASSNSATPFGLPTHKQSFTCFTSNLTTSKALFFKKQLKHQDSLCKVNHLRWCWWKHLPGNGKNQAPALMPTTTRRDKSQVTPIKSYSNYKTEDDTHKNWAGLHDSPPQFPKANHMDHAGYVNFTKQKTIAERSIKRQETTFLSENWVLSPISSLLISHVTSFSDPFPVDSNGNQRQTNTCPLLHSHIFGHHVLFLHEHLFL